MKGLVHIIKSVIYRVGVDVLRFYWNIIGGRRVTVFGENIILLPTTVFPSFWNLRLPTGGATSRICRYGDYVQMHSMVGYVSELKYPAVVIDIGAHHGAYAIVLGKILQKTGGRIIAIEPNPLSFAVLERNVSLNGLNDTVYCERVAVSDRAGEIHISMHDVQSQISDQQSSESVSVDMVTLSFLMEKYKIDSVDVLQIDVEGAELPVLNGFPWKIGKVGKIYCELHPYAWSDFHYTGKDVQQFIEEHNMQCFDMYLNEHKTFEGLAYIGPTVFISQPEPN